MNNTPGSEVAPLAASAMNVRRRHAPVLLDHAGLTLPLQAIMQAESIDAFAAACRDLLQRAMPLHSLCISFSPLEYVCPWLIRDTLPVRGDPGYITERYHLLNPSRPFLRRNVGVAQSLFEEQADTMPAPALESYLRRFRQHEGWDKYAEIHFWADQSLQANICVRRAPTQPDFSTADLRLLAELRAALGATVEQLHRRHRERATTNCFHQVLDDLPVPLLILDWELEPTCFNHEARRACAAWLVGEESARALKIGSFDRVPAEIIAACKAEKASLERSGFSARDRGRFVPHFRSVSHPVETHLTAQIEVMTVPSELIGLPHFLIRFQSAPAESNGASRTGKDPKTLAVLSCLTPRERDVAILVAQGLSNRAIAARLSRELATVKMHLRSVFKKLKVSNRTRIAVLLAQPDAGARHPTAPGTPDCPNRKV